MVSRTLRYEVQKLIPAWSQNRVRGIHVYYSVIVYYVRCKSNNNVNKKNEVDQKKGNTPEARADLLWVTDTRIFTRFHNRFMWLRL